MVPVWIGMAYPGGLPGGGQLSQLGGAAEHLAARPVWVAAPCLWVSFGFSFWGLSLRRTRLLPLGLGRSPGRLTTGGWERARHAQPTHGVEDASGGHACPPSTPLTGF